MLVGWRSDWQQSTRSLRLPSLDPEVNNLLETFTAWDRCFTVQEVASFSGELINREALRQSFLNDGRFILAGRSMRGLECFLPEHKLFQWWSRLNLRLATIGQSRLNSRQLSAAIDSLYDYNVTLWTTCPPGILEYGQRLGFVAPAWLTGSYVFPFAHLLSQIKPSPLWRGSQARLGLWAEDYNPSFSHTSLSGAIELVLAKLDAKLAEIIRHREALPPYERKTLEQLGSVFGVTRERIRQLEQKFWKRLRHPRQAETIRLIWDSVVGAISKPGGLVHSDDEEETSYIRFAAKCLGIPYVPVGAGNLIVLGAEVQSLRADIEGNEQAFVHDDVEQVAELLNSGPCYFLDRAATLRVAQAIVKDGKKDLTKQEKVYLALKQIGKSAHYSDVAHVYGQLYPEDVMSEHNIHAILSRCASPNLELYGIVWIGSKGKYALKEHGYERPTLSLHEAVALIVEEKYEATQRPVHINVIISELGKHRREVNKSSLAFATGANQDILQVEKEYFVPKDANRTIESEDVFGDLDSVLREFQQAHASGT